MTKEIYTRTVDDPYYEAGIIDFSNEIESKITKIRTLLSTKPGDVLGDYNFGIDLDYLVFNTKASASDVKQRIDEKLAKYVPNTSNVTVSTEVSFGHSGYGYDYAVIDIYINGTKAVGLLVDKE